MQHSQFSHVDLVLPDGNLIGSSDNPNAPVIEGNPCGVAIRPPNYQKFRTRRIAEVDCSRPSEDALYEWMRTQLGKPFDHNSMIAMMNEANIDDLRDWRDPEVWFCSEYLCRGIERSGILTWMLVVAKNRISPADLLFIINPLMTNAATFNLPIEGLTLDPGEV